MIEDLSKDPELEAAEKADEVKPVAKGSGGGF